MSWICNVSGKTQQNQKKKFWSISWKLTSLEFTWVSKAETQENWQMSPRMTLKTSKNQESWWCSSHLKGIWPETRKNWHFSLSTKTGEGSWAGNNSLLLKGESAFFFYSGLELIEWGPQTGRTICFVQSTSLYVNLIQNNSQTHPE